MRWAGAAPDPNRSAPRRHPDDQHPRIDENGVRRGDGSRDRPRCVEHHRPASSRGSQGPAVPASSTGPVTGPLVQPAGVDVAGIGHRALHRAGTCGVSAGHQSGKRADDAAGDQCQSAVLTARTNNVNVAAARSQFSRSKRHDAAASLKGRCLARIRSPPQSYAPDQIAGSLLVRRRDHHRSDLVQPQQRARCTTPWRRSPG
jgi:hypothetical protein